MTNFSSGTIEGLLTAPDVADVRAGGREIVRRLGVRVRRPDWSTSPAVLSELAVSEIAGSFEATFAARHLEADLDVTWRGSVWIRDGVLGYEMDGRFDADSAYARVGIVLLHPPEVTAGRPFRARGRGETVSGTLPELIGPQLVEAGVIQPLVPAFEELEVEVAPGCTLVFEFEGDAFEMEDQRNWTDASFKTYSTPIGLSVPHRAALGDRVRQRVRVHARGTAPSYVRHRGGAPLEVSLGGPLKRRLLPIGVGLGRSGSHELVRAVGPAHVGVRVPLDGSPETILRTAGRASSGVALELAVLLPEDPVQAGDRLAELAAALEDDPAPIARIAIHSHGAEVTRLRDLELARASLSGTLLVGSPSNFAELNRARSLALANADGLAFGVNPQVHDRDDALVLQAAGAQRDAVLTARSFAGSLPVHVAPIGFSPPLPAKQDGRFRLPFAAAWTVASAAALAAEGVASATFFSLSGLDAVVHDGALLPVGEIIATLCGWGGAPLLEVDLEDPQRTAAIAVYDGGKQAALVANLTPSELELRVAGERQPVGPYGVIRT